MCNLETCEHIAPNITDFPSDPQNPTDVTVVNWDDMPLGIEASLAPVGCVYDVDGVLVGKVFISKITDEETQAETNVLQYIDRATGTIVPYDQATHGVWQECQNQDTASPELDAIVANWLPICVDGTQWYVREKEIIDNADGTITSTVLEYKDGADGSITTTAPTGTITEGYCQTTVTDFDVELIVLCDQATDGTITDKFIRTITWVNGVPTSVVDTELDGTTPYVVSGKAKVCDDEYHVDKECYQALVDGDGYLAGDKVYRDSIIKVGENPLIPIRFIWVNKTQGTLIFDSVLGGPSADPSLSPADFGDCQLAPSELTPLPHQVGCIVTPEQCQVVNDTMTIPGTEFLSFRVTANDGNGNFTVVQTVASEATKDQLVQILTDLASAGTRAIETITGVGTYFFWDGNFDNVTDISVGSTYEIQYDYHVEAGVTDAPNPHLSAPCTEPYPDSDYQNTATLLGGWYASVPLDTDIPNNGTENITFDINTYQAIVGGRTQVKQFVYQDSDGNLIEEYRELGNLGNVVPFDPVTETYLPNCVDGAVDTIVECAGATTVTDTFDSSRYDFTDVVEPLAGYPTYNFEDFSTNTPSGLVIDGNYAKLVVPDGITISASIKDGSQLTNFVDFLGNGTGADSGPTLDLGTDPTGASFISSFIADTLVALSDFGLTAPTQVSTRSSSVSGGSLQFTIDFFGTEGITQANYLNYFTTSLNGNQYFYGLNADYELNSTFDPIVIPGNPTAITATFNLDIPTGADIVLGLNIGGIFGDQAQPYVFVNGNGVPTEYTYTFVVSGTDPISGSYSITGADLAIPDNIHAWVYFESSSPGTTYRVDGVRLSVTYDTSGGSQPANLVALCDTQLKEITDRLDLLANDTGGGTQLLTRFQSDTTDNIYSFVPSAPSGTKTISVTNDSSYYIRIGTNIGDIIVAPGRIGTMSVEDTEPDIVINYLSDVGGYTPGERIVFNFERRL